MPSHKILRPSGTLPHPNILGGFLGAAIFTTSFLFIERAGKQKIFIAAALLIQIFAVFLTYSRAALFGLLGGSVLYFILLLKWKTPKKTVIHLALVIAFACATSTAALYEQIKERGGILNQNEYVAKASNIPRLQYQKLALSMAKKRPLTGHGWGQFLTELEPIEKETSTIPLQRVHNIYLLILAEVGIPGLLAFGAFLISLLYWAVKGKGNLIQATLLTVFAYFLWIGVVDYYWLTTQQGRLLFLLIL